jgi:hypothetical protein
MQAKRGSVTEADLLDIILPIFDTKRLGSLILDEGQSQTLSTELSEN